MKEQAQKRTWQANIKRYVFLCAGLAVMAFGVAFSIRADLGTSPISSVPSAVSEFTPLTVGTATIIMHCVFIVLQILILRRRYRIVQLMQLPVAVVFGYFTDFCVWALEGVSFFVKFRQGGVQLVELGVALLLPGGNLFQEGEGVGEECVAMSIEFTG